MINRIVAEIKYNTIYQCACGAEQVGSTAHVSLDVNSAYGLMEAMAHQQQTSHHMPIGWSYNGKFECPVCTRPKMKELNCEPLGRS